MDNLMAGSDIADNNVTKKYLEELLDQVVSVKSSVSEKECEKTKASDELDSLTDKIRQIIVAESELKSKHVLSPKQLNEQPFDDTARAQTSFKNQFNQLERILGITINLSLEKKSFEITFNDVQQSKVSFSYKDKGIEIEMHPVHQNFDAIREHLRETGDLLGFLMVFSSKLTKA